MKGIKDGNKINSFKSIKGLKKSNKREEKQKGREKSRGGWEIGAKKEEEKRTRREGEGVSPFQVEGWVCRVKSTHTSNSMKQNK